MIATHMTQLEDAGLIWLAQIEPALAYRFRHIRLVDLRDLADYQQEPRPFRERLAALCNHYNSPARLRRFRAAGLLGK